MIPLRLDPRRRTVDPIRNENGSDRNPQKLFFRSIDLLILINSTTPAINTSLAVWGLFLLLLLLHQTQFN